MATSKKRIIVYVDDHYKQRMDAVARKMGSSVSSVFGDYLIKTLPQLEQVADTVHLARTDPAAAMERMKKLAEESQGDLLQAMEGLNDESSDV